MQNYCNACVNRCTIYVIQTGAYLVLAGIMLCAALVFVALSIFYYEYVPMVEIEDKRNYSILAAMMSINNVFAVHTVDIDEDEELSRKLSFCIHSYRAVGSSNVSTRSLQRIRRELKENNPKEKEMREDKEDYLQHKLSIQHQMQRLEEKVRDLLSHNKKKKRR